MTNQLFVNCEILYKLNINQLYRMNNVIIATMLGSKINLYLILKKGQNYEKSVLENVRG